MVKAGSIKYRTEGIEQESMKNQSTYCIRCQIKKEDSIKVFVR